MSKTMMSQKRSLNQMAQSIYVKDTITLQINHEFLNHNFLMIKQCLLKVQQLNNQMGKQRSSKTGYQKQINQLKSKILENQKTIAIHQHKFKQIQNNLGDNLMKKIYQIQNKTKNLPQFDQILTKLSKSNIFVSSNDLQKQNQIIKNLELKSQKLKQQFHRYVQIVSFDKYKDNINNQIKNIKDQLSLINNKNNDNQLNIKLIKGQSDIACEQVKQNNKMLKQVNFSQMLDKIKKFKQDSQQKISEISLKLKKKCGTNDLADLQKNIIQKLDKFFLINEKGKASIDQTKNALLYLEKRLNQIIQIFSSKQNDSQNDALFSIKKVNCASCTKDLGKFQGKLGQFRPWAVFPCKQLDPQKTGGFGFLSYIDKVGHKRGNSIDDSNFQRLNKTFLINRNNQEESPTKMNSTRTTNFMTNYGQDSKPNISLKDEYFKEIKTQKNLISNSKIFRVKKDSVKPSTLIQINK